MAIENHTQSVSTRLKSGISREHSYRGDFEALLREMASTNEPANVTDCGNLDYVITKGKIPVGYIEAKDISKDRHLNFEDIIHYQKITVTLSETVRLMQEIDKIE